MTQFDVEDEREELEARRQETRSRLAALLAQQATLNPTTFKQRHDALLSEIHRIEHRLADVKLDEQSLKHMEGGE